MSTSPILHDLPEVIETERLLIRAPRPGDGLPTYEAVLESLPELRQWMTWAQQMDTPEEHEIRVRRAIAHFHLRDDMRMNLFRKTDDLLAGICGIHLRDPVVPSYEIGYWARTSCQGQGYITEAVQALTRLTFEKLAAQRIEIHCDGDNHRSAAVAERCGYILEARLHHHRRNMQGQLSDTLIYARLPGS
jgi:RimJ/RimL family protein N-acetyltransferase